MNGFLRQEVDAMIDRDRTINRQKLYELDFEIEYGSPIEQFKNEIQRQTRPFEKDKTSLINPKFKNFFLMV